jgi:UDP-GlcNAc:undecaprenyl-phosphate GlcNAc-1-phosphate transferase
VLLMFLYPEMYGVGIAFGVVGAAACLTITFLPSRRTRRSQPTRSPEEILTPVEELP